MATNTISSVIQDSGNTNVNNVTWVRYGNVVTVSVNAVVSVSNITGLPEPKSSWLLSPLIAGDSARGYISYSSGAWAITNPSGYAGYGGITYICK